jgi:fructokinase
MYSIGETIYDILLKDSRPIAAKAGGSMLNAAVSLGRMGLSVQLVTEIGNDPVGKLILEFLLNNRVQASYSWIFNEGKTALALAFLDEKEEAHYTFYKNYPENRFHIPFPDFQADDIVLFGSFFALSEEVRKPLKEFLEKARNAGALIVYDPNVRKTQLGVFRETPDMLTENFELADIVRGTAEDFNYLFGTKNAMDAYEKICEFGNKILFYTDGPGSVEFLSEKATFSRPVPKIQPVSTVGAGDSFNAGIVYSLLKLGISRPGLFETKIEDWRTAADTGINFGSVVCQSYDNYIPMEFAAKLNH